MLTLEIKICQAQIEKDKKKIYEELLLQKKKIVESFN